MNLFLLHDLFSNCYSDLVTLHVFFFFSFPVIICRNSLQLLIRCEFELFNSTDKIEDDGETWNEKFLQEIIQMELLKAFTITGSKIP